MKFILPLVSSAVAVTAWSPGWSGSWSGSWGAGRPSWGGGAPAPDFCKCANETITKYAAILRNESYNGETPFQLAQDIIAPDYQDFSESVRSLIGEPLDGTPESQNRTAWIKNIQLANTFKPPPYAGLVSKEILCTGIVLIWSWELTAVGRGTYPVSGIQKFYLDNNGQIMKSYFEFNSIAWSADTGQINLYCPGGKLGPKTS